MEDTHEPVIDLDALDVIDLVDAKEPLVAEFVASPNVRRAVAHALRTLHADEVVARALTKAAIAEQRAAEANARAAKAEALAATDALTGLGNQRAWWDRIAEEDARIQRSEAPAVIAVVDLDDLKTVNDERGHLHGDLLLRLTATTLRDAVRTCDHVARVGGDEFAVLAVDFDGEASVLAERLVEALEAADIRASVGVAAPHSGASLVDAYARADHAMYQDKRRRGRRTSRSQGG